MSNYPTSNNGSQQATSTTYTGYGVVPAAYPLPNLYPVEMFPVNPPFVSSSTTVVPPPPATFQGGYSFNSDFKPDANSDLLQNLPKSSKEPSDISIHKENAKSMKKEKGTLSKDKCCNMNDASDHHRYHHHHHHHPDYHRHHHDYDRSQYACRPKKEEEHYWFC